MTNREIAKLALKFLSVYIFVFAILAIPTAFLYLRAYPSNDAMSQLGKLQAYAFVGSTLLRLLFGVLLWFAADKLADRLAGGEQSPADSSPVDPKSYLDVGIALIGAYLAATGIVGVVGTIITLTPSGASIPPMDYLKIFLDPSRAGSSRLIVGLIMIFGAHWFAQKQNAYLKSEETSAK